MKSRKEHKRYSRHFCSRYCASRTSLQNNRSQAEIFMEEIILTEYPDIDLRLNVKDWCREDLELDLYIPSINLAVEINGPTHYKPIYGIDKFERTVRNDKKKKGLCKNLGITLIVVDVSYPEYGKKERSRQILLDIFHAEVEPHIRKAYRVSNMVA